MSGKLGKNGPYHLGKNIPRYDGRALHISNYLTIGQLPPAPDTLDWSAAVTVPWQMDFNDMEGCCTIAGLAHIIMATSANAGKIVIPDADEVDAVYRKLSGYDGTDATDTGLTEQDAMKYCRQYGLAGQKADAYADINIADVIQLKQSMAIFGPAYIGVWLSDTDIRDFDSGHGWANVSDTTQIGGHAIPIVGYDNSDVEVVTWGRKQPCTWNWLLAHMDEAHALLFYNFINKDTGLSPRGFDLATMERDLGMVTGL